MSEIKNIKIKSLEILNFKSIQNAKVTFDKNFNIIIGPNGSGKSNLLEMINYATGYNIINRLKLGYRRNLRNYSISLSYLEDNANVEVAFGLRKIINTERHFLKSDTDLVSEIQIVKKNKGERTTKKFVITEKELAKGLKDKNILEQVYVLRKIRKKYLRFSLPDNDDMLWVAKPANLNIDENGNTEFAEFSVLSLMDDFELIVSDKLGFELSDDKQLDIVQIKKIIFDTFSEFNIDNDVIETLNRYTPIQEIRINNNINIYQVEKKYIIENLFFEFMVNDTWMPWSYLSDGTKRLFYIITEALSLKSGILIIEEPELGIHPKQLFQLMNFFKEQSLEKQVFISTHSPIVLDILSPKELSSIIISKYGKKGSGFRKLTSKEKIKAIDYMNSVGELSYYWLHSDLEHE